MRRGVAAFALLALVGGAACTPARAAPPAGEVTVVEVTIRYSRFQPSLMTFAPGERVRFVIRNADPIDHEFILGDQGVQDRHENGTEPYHGRIPGEVSIPAGSTAESTYHFTEAGTLLFGCHLPGHYAYGMRGTVRVG